MNNSLATSRLSVLRIFSLLSFLILVSSISSASEMNWKLYKDKDAKFETYYPSNFSVSTNMSEGYQVLKFVYRSKAPDFNYLDLWVMSKACTTSPACTKADLTLSLSPNAKVDNVQMCREALTDHAMGGRWAAHIVYSGSHNGMCYRIGYEGHEGFDIDKNGAGHRPKSEKEFNPKKDPHVLSEMIQRFKFK